MVGLLVLLSLILITISFRGPSSGVARGIETAGATVLRPFEVAAERIARPFRDVYGYFAGLVHVKRENERLKEEVTRLRQQALQGGTAVDTFTLGGATTFNHQKTVQLLLWVIASGENADLQRFASSSLPDVLHHLQMAQTLVSLLTGAAAPTN